jgi:hypothetical protein
MRLEVLVVRTIIACCTNEAIVFYNLVSVCAKTFPNLDLGFIRKIEPIFVEHGFFGPAERHNIFG